MKVSIKKYFKICVGFTAILFFLSFVYQLLVPKTLYDKSSKNEAVKYGKTVCVLPDLDPWDKEVLPFLEQNWDPLEGCTVKTVMQTELKDGVLQQLPNSTSKCFYRCLYAHAEDQYSAGKWQEMRNNESYREECEFIETHCKKTFRTTFRYIHSQVLRPKRKIFQEEDDLHPSVLMFVLDSVSSSSGIRSASKTIQILRQHYEAILFNHHNKVGKNSRPNAFAMFAGVRITNLDELRFPNESAPEVSNSCQEGLKKDETITYDFVNQYYATIIAEDWVGAFTYPDCHGYDFVPTDHYTSPLIVRSTSSEDEKIFDKYLYTGKCQQTYHKIVNYVTKFLAVYENVAKFVVVWLSNPAHGVLDGIYSIDKFLANFFLSNLKLLNNTFIFFMGDHGLRLGAFRSTQIGHMEDNNPMLVIAVPKYLRANKQLMENLRVNSRRHTSHYDFYTTLYDLAHTAREEQFKRWNFRNFRLDLGEKRGGIRARSLLRLIEYNRTCDEMEIPDEFCLCRQAFQKISTRSQFVQEAAAELLRYLNHKIELNDPEKMCSKLELLEVFMAQKMESRSRLRLIIVTAPGHALVEAEMEKGKGNYDIILPSLIRIDRYEEQSQCIGRHNIIQPFCYCRKQKANHQ